MVLGLSPVEVGIEPSYERPAFGFVLETVIAAGNWYTLACLRDGTVSVYSAGTFGIIGVGALPQVRDAAYALLSVVDEQLELFGAPSADTALPPPGSATLRALAIDGARSITAPEDDLLFGRHPASPLFRLAHAVLSQAEQSLTHDH